MSLTASSTLARKGELQMMVVDPNTNRIIQYCAAVKIVFGVLRT
jgi:hypothetical protein